MRRPRPVVALRRMVDWFEERGVYVPGDDNQPVSAWHDFGWLFILWLATVAVFVLFFAVAV